MSSSVFTRIKMLLTVATAVGLVAMPVAANSANQQSKKILTPGTNSSNGLLAIGGGNWWEEGKRDPVIHLIVDKALQKVSVYSNGKLITTSNVSTGKEGHETPGGIFSVLSKNRVHHSNIYSRSPMPFMQRLTWSGIALHESNSVPAYPASHGCIRLPGTFASQLFKFTHRGAQVIVTAQNVRPEEFSSPDIFDIGIGTPLHTSSLRPTVQVVPGTVNSIPGADDKPIRILLTRNSGREKLMEIQNILNQLKYDAGEADGWMGPQTGKAILAFQKDYKHKKTGALSDALLGQLYRATGRGKPKNGHVYVRRNKKPLFDVAVVLADEKVPLGTHHFTAVVPDSSTEIAQTGKPHWLSLSIEETGWAGRDEGDFTAPSSPKRALARFDIPDDLKTKLSRLIIHESTVVISDQGISKETVATGTDFIVLTK